jgi:TRAP-type C4-dicarboxylate transport system permease small subunit
MRKLLSHIEKVLTIFSIASVFLLVFLTVADTGGRYLLNKPISGAYEITEKYLMVVAVFFGFCHGYRNGCNIRATLLVSHFSPQVKIVVAYVVQALSVVYGILLVLGTFRRALLGIQDSMMDAYGIPLGPAFMVAPVGLFALTLWLVYDVGQVKNGKSGLFVEEGTPAS